MSTQKFFVSKKPKPSKKTETELIDELCEMFKDNRDDLCFVKRNKSRIKEVLRKLFRLGLLSAEESACCRPISDIEGGEATLKKLECMVNGKFKAQRKKKFSLFGERTEVLRELQSLATIRHPNVIAVEKIFFEHQKQSGFLYLNVIMPWIDETLLSWLLGEKDAELKNLGKNKGMLKIKRSFKEIRKAMTEILMGIAAIHACMVIHMDLKPQNILMQKNTNENEEGDEESGDDDYTAVIIDFGHAKYMKSLSMNFGGTGGYFAPEIIKAYLEQKFDQLQFEDEDDDAKENAKKAERAKIFTPKVDIYAFGVILYRIFIFQSEGPPRIDIISKSTIKQRIKNVFEIPNESIPEEVLEDLVEIIKICLKDEKDNRPHASQLLYEHKYFNDYAETPKKSCQTTSPFNVNNNEGKPKKAWSPPSNDKQVQQSLFGNFSPQTNHQSVTFKAPTATNNSKNSLFQQKKAKFPFPDPILTSNLFTGESFSNLKPSDSPLTDNSSTNRSPIIFPLSFQEVAPLETLLQQFTDALMNLEGNFVAAFEIFKKLSETHWNGKYAARYICGWMLYNGFGNCIDEKAGKEMMETNAKQAATFFASDILKETHGFKSFFMGKILHTGGSNLEIDATAFQYLQKSSEDGNSFAWDAMGEIYVSSKDQVNAIQCFKVAADSGNVNGMVHLGTSYFYQLDKDLALKWYQDAANQGYCKAQYKFGLILLQAGEATGNYQLKLAADQGYDLAIMSYADNLATGHGIEKDIVTAKKYYQALADKGNESARETLVMKKFL